MPERHLSRPVRCVRCEQFGPHEIDTCVAYLGRVNLPQALRVLADYLNTLRGKVPYRSPQDLGLAQAVLMTHDLAKVVSVTTQGRNPTDPEW
jgi:hypothetical protein